MAQLRPGQKVRFGLVTLNDARMALWQQRQDLERAMLMASLLERHGADELFAVCHATFPVWQMAFADVTDRV